MLIPMDGRLLKDIIGEALDHQSFSAKKLAEATGVPEGYIKHLLEGELKKLPPAPYVRGYLTKISSTLDLDLRDLWQTYIDEVAVLDPNQFDRLPVNRYAAGFRIRKFLFFGILAIAVIIYLSWNAGKFIGLPYLEINHPTDEIITTTESFVTIEGASDYANKLTINDEQIYLEKNGQFRRDYSLQEGLNTFEIKSKKFLGREAVVIKKVIYQKPTPIEPIKEIEVKN